MRSGFALSALAFAGAALVAGCGSTQVHASAPATATVQGTRSTTAPQGQTTGTGVAATPSRASTQIAPVVRVELFAPLAQYEVYVTRLLARLKPEVRALQTAAESGNQKDAERDWIAAHVSWLEIGQDDNAYGAFGELGEQIDGPANGLSGTTGSRDFTGFHKVERDLWREHDMPAAAADTGTLVSLVGQLTRATVANDLPNTALALDGWVLRCHEILEDALRDSLSQNDDYGSNSDLTSLAADATATREMLIVLAPLIEARVPKIVTQGSRDLISIDEAIQSAGGPLTRRNLAALAPRTRQAIDQATSAALETLAPVSELMQVVVPGS